MLIHVLNCCTVARDERRYNARHDAVLRAIASSIKDCFPPSTIISADLDGEYVFPTHITPTDMRPDIAWWNDEDKQLWLVKLTVSFETSFEGASQRKETKYEDIVAAARESGYKTTLITVEVGSRGVPHMPGFKKLSQTLHLSRSQLTNLLHHVKMNG